MNCYNKITLLLISVLIFSFNIYEDSFINNYNEKAMYQDELSCSLFKENTGYKHYQPMKCFKLKYNFSESELEKLEKLYFKISGLNRNELDLNPTYIVSLALDNSKQELFYKNYGLYVLNGVKFSPNFYFLRTEKDIYFYNCDEKDQLIEYLNESQYIDETFKNRINQFTDERCSVKDGLKWYSGARFF